VRYLAFESGLDAYKPVAPNKVLAARYGDCKANALPLCSILRLNGVEAYPVLVNSSKIKSDSIRLPSYRIFNHTVVQLIRNGDSFFVDPTISNQGGRIDDIYIPDYGYGLVVKENPDSLIRLVNHTSSETCVKNYFTINKINGPADLKIVTRHTGNYADETRSYFKSRSLDEISRDYLKFYSNNYPYIRTSAQVKFTDDRDSNLFIVEENYIIDSIWMPSEKNKKEIVLTFAAHVINGIINVPASPERTMPYAITFPMNFIEDVYVSLPEEWPVNPFRKEIIDSAFRFSSDVSYADCNIKLNYKYSTLADHIPAKNFRSYYSNHQEVQNNLSYSITYNTAAIGDFKISWYAIILFVIITISGVYFAFRIFRHYNLAFNGTRSREIGGWLILIGLGLVISFGRIFYTIFLDVQYFDKKLWETVLGSFSIEDVSVFMLLSFELLVNTLMLIYNGLLLILFFKKRNIFPRLMIICLTVSAVFITVDTLVAFSVYPDTFTAEDKSTSYMQIGRSIISSIIWITYLVYSKRVKETFTEVSTYSTSALKDSIHVAVRE